MKKFAIGTVVIAALIGTPAAGADVAVKAPPPARTSAPYSWTGFYLGGEFGAGWSDEAVSYSPNDLLATLLLNGGVGRPPPVFRIPQAGGVAGIEAGYNWQAGANWLLGLEADFSAAGIDGRGNGTSAFIPVGANPVTQTVTVQQSTDWYGTVRGRIGWLATPNFLLFGSGGFAYGRVAGNANLAFNSPAVTLLTAGGAFGSFQCVTNRPCFTGSSAEIRTGWVVGGGAEHLLDQHWSAKIEYQFVDLGTHTVRLTALPNPGFPPSSINVASRDRFNVVRVGLNYRF